MKKIFSDDNFIDREGVSWRLTIFETMVLDNDGNLVNSNSMERNMTEAEQEWIDIQKNINELKEVILNKKLLDLDCSLEQSELKILIGY